MATSTSDTISTLNNLIETLKDGEEGYREAAQAISRPDLRSEFQQYAEQRARYAQELQSEVTRLGKTPETSGSTIAAIHRGWINLKSAVTGKDDKAIVNEVERGEDSAKKNYEEALAKDLPSDLKSVIQSQSSGVLEAHNKMRDLKHSMGS